MRFFNRLSRGAVRSSDTSAQSPTAKDEPVSSGTSSSTSIGAAAPRSRMRRAERITMLIVQLEAKLDDAEWRWHEVLDKLHLNNASSAEIDLVELVIEQVQEWSGDLRRSIEVPASPAFGLSRD